jgi:PIN domain nuclease of toxin-antitoxin system
LNLLLDTCAILHLASSPERLSKATQALVTNPGHLVHVSPISIAELACLVERGRVQLGKHWRPWFEAAVRDNGWNVVPISLEIAAEDFALPSPFHRDPADRILVATARTERMALVTTDRLILDYPHVQAVS